MDLIAWVLLPIVAVLGLWFALRPKRRESSPVIAHIRGNGKFAVDVVGESFYRENLVALTKDKWSDSTGDTVRFIAVLRLDDANEHDPLAVAVLIGGRQVGHLDRQTAREFRDAVQRDGLGPRSEFAVDAEVWIPDRPNVDNYGVCLDLPKA